MSDQIEKRLDELRQCSKEYAKAKSERVYLEEFRKSKIAILMKKYACENGPNGQLFSTAAAQEREARADPEYLELLKELKKATETEEKHRWELKISDWGIDLWRTKQANRRAEHKAYGG